MKPCRPKAVWPAVHGGIFLAAWLFTAQCCPTLLWPLFLVLPLAIYACVVSACLLLRQTIPRLSAGRLTPTRVAVAVGLSLLTTIALLVYQHFEKPDVNVAAAAIPVAAFGSILLAGACFSIINAILEELIFRGLIYEAIATEWTNSFAVVVTSVVFGVCHLRGYPPGPLGAVMAGLYGLALASMRWWCGGLALAIACHISADATIFYILATAGAFCGTPD
jgi:membrane protease YdiL (CAAX protease family)